MGKAGNIGDVVKIKGEYLFNLSSINSFSDNATGESPPEKAFEKKFRYSKDGVKFSSWLSLTLDNLRDIPLSQGDLLYTEYSYKRIGTDDSGILEVSKVTLGVTYSSDYPDRPNYYDSFISRVIDWFASPAIEWSINVLRKVTEKGSIIPTYVSTTTDDAIAFWRSVTDFFSWLIVYTRKVVDVGSDISLLRRFLDSRGYYYSNNDNHSAINDVRTHIHNEMAHRGTREHIDVEVKNILNNDVEKEYCLELSDNHKVGWSVGNSSPLNRTYEDQPQFVKAYERSKGFVNLSNYPIINSDRSTINSNDELEVSSLSGSFTGILMGGQVQDQFIFPVSPLIPYQVKAIVKVTDPSVKISMGMRAFDVNKAEIGLLRANSDSPSDFFLEAKQINQSGRYYLIRGLVFPWNKTYPFFVSSPMINDFGGYHLQMKKEAHFVSPFLYLDNSSNDVNGALVVKDFEFSHLSSERSLSFIGLGNAISAKFINDRSKYSNRSIETRVDNLLKPYNSHVFYDWLGISYEDGGDGDVNLNEGLVLSYDVDESSTHDDSSKLVDTNGLVNDFNAEII